MEGLVRAMGGSAETTTCGGERFDPRFIKTTTDVAALTDRLAQPGAGRNWSALLSGPPGTGKSQYARYIADQLDMPVLQKRASDLISKWLGESEKQIAQAFEEAVAESALLIFDEADSLLAARNADHPPWQTSQVNEMLTWMESHPLPFVCTTNFLSSLDPASLRRFTFKLDFGFLDQAQAEALFLYRFGAEAPTPLPDRLTPGDFAVVEKRRRFEPGATCLDLVTWLDEEVAVRSPAKAIGFAVPRTITAKAA
jgi:SpoVK/Ycf46/Vps4 family AAA+-type ATPase